MSADARTVREEREHGGRTAVGEVVLADGVAPEADDQRAAAARAWLSIAEGLVDEDDGEGAYAAASRGVDELGDTYLGDEVEDDTTLKLLAAEDGHASGSDHAGTAMARVLSDRLALWVDAQGGRVVG